MTERPPTQAGAPVITVRNKCVNQTNQVSLTVDRFVSTPNSPSPNAQAWTLPVCFKSAGGA